MRTQYQLQVQQARIQNANDLLAWLDKNRELSGESFFSHVVGPYSTESGLENFEVWKAWDILRKTKRCKAYGCWKWEILSKEPVAMREDGSAA